MTRPAKRYQTTGERRKARARKPPAVARPRAIAIAVMSEKSSTGEA
jgi:hypothetical protein